MSYGVCVKEYILLGMWIGLYEGRCLFLWNFLLDIDMEYFWEVRFCLKIRLFLGFIGIKVNSV